VQFRKGQTVLPGRSGVSSSRPTWATTSG
jgi:hypothetical protein